MMGNQKRDVKKYFFMLPNAMFELGFHVYELAIYAYLPVSYTHLFHLTRRVFVYIMQK